MTTPPSSRICLVKRLATMVPRRSKMRLASTIPTTRTERRSRHPSLTEVYRRHSCSPAEQGLERGRDLRNGNGKKGILCFGRKSEMRGEREGRKGVSGLGRGVAGVLRLCAGSTEIAKAPQNAGETKPLREASVRDWLRGGAGDGGGGGNRTHVRSGATEASTCVSSVWVSPRKLPGGGPLHAPAAT